MSTRRARIKAVTSLPPRRKNAENCDNKTKAIPPKEDVDRASTSPKPPRFTNEGSANSPNTKTLNPIKSPRAGISNNVKNVLEQIKVPTPLVERSSTPKVSEKTYVSTSMSSFKSDNIFMSPPAKFSPLKKYVPSPVHVSKAVIDNSPKTKVIEQKLCNNLVKTNDGDNESQKSDVIHNQNSKADNRADVPDDYNVPSVPESIPEDAMDGIVPLQPANNAPNPVALLKNEIISENAEVLFDPIVPLPSPSKVRPKLRPAPRLAPLRRNSVQGSASESEDENRRALLSSGSATPAPQRHRNDSHTSHSTLHSLPNREANRVRNDSVCSSVGHSAPAQATSPVKEKHYHKTRRQEMSRRMAAMHRRREAVKRDALTMYDLIFYNPVSKPFVPDQDEVEAKEANEKESSSKSHGKTGEEHPEDPPAPSAAPVPQIKLGPNGEIILDEQSLVIKQSNGNRRVSGVVREGAWGRASGSGSYRRTPRTAEWSDADTVRFYRALAALGTDFTLMQPLFPSRTRRDLKLKFKREEKLNGGQVDKALRSTVEWDAVRLQEEFSAEREAAARRAQRDRDLMRQNARSHRDRMRTAKELGVRMNKTTKALESSIFPKNTNVTENDAMTADEIIQRAVREKAARKRKPKNHDPTEPLTFPLKKTPQQTPPPHLATLTLINSTPGSQKMNENTTDLATLSKVDPRMVKPMPENLNPVSASVPSNIETGSLVVLTVNDPNSPMKKMLQTYIAHGAGKLTPVNLPPTLLNSVVGYMKKGTPKSNRSARSSPSLTSPSSVTSQDSRTSGTPGLGVNSSPRKRQRHSSYTITPL